MNTAREDIEIPPAAPGEGFQRAGIEDTGCAEHTPGIGCHIHRGTLGGRRILVAGKIRNRKLRKQRFTHHNIADEIIDSADFAGHFLSGILHGFPVQLFRCDIPDLQVLPVNQSICAQSLFRPKADVIDEGKIQQIPVRQMLQQCQVPFTVDQLDTQIRADNVKGIQRDRER